MSRHTRLVVFGLGALGVGTLFVLAFLVMPPFGGHFHPYRDHSIPAAVRHGTANVVSSINFDQRGLDTLAEESILLASVVAVSILLRPSDDERVVTGRDAGRVLDSTLLGAVVMVPVTMLIGFDVIAHGALTPGGGFQGGVVLGTGVHLAYVGGTSRFFHRLRPVRPFEWGEAIGAGAFACVGIAGVFAGGAFLQNMLPTGAFGTLFSSGTVPVLNAAVGVEVASGVIVLVSCFLAQTVLEQRGHHNSGDRR